MSKQELFFEQEIGGTRIEVLKVYDKAYAREAFVEMDEAALEHLWQALEPEKNYDPAGLPGRDDPTRADFLWDELLETAREDYDQFSFFVVTEIMNNRMVTLYVSSDWPSAEAFAKHRIRDKI
jgi:hypothetical protein